MMNFVVSPYSNYLLFVKALISSDFIQVDFKLDDTRTTFVCKYPIKESVNEEIQERVDAIMKFNECSKTSIINTHFDL